MEKIAVFVNDVAAARHILEPMLEGEGPIHWVLVVVGERDGARP